MQCSTPLLCIRNLVFVPRVSFTLAGCQVIMTIGDANTRYQSIDLAPRDKYLSCVTETGRVNLHDLFALRRSSLKRQRARNLSKVSSLALHVRSPFVQFHPVRVTTEQQRHGARATSAHAMPAPPPLPPPPPPPEPGPRSEGMSGDMEVGLTGERLRALLSVHGQFPDKYRTLIWKVGTITMSSQRPVCAYVRVCLHSYVCQKS